MSRRRDSGSALPAAAGVHATPPPLVGYVVRSVGALLRSRFDLAAGLGDLSVRVLDPAAGPFNFLLAAWKLAAAERRRAGDRDLAGLARDHLLPHFAGCELLPGSHARGLDAACRFLRRLGLGAGEAALPRLLRTDALEAPAPPGRGAGAPFFAPEKSGPAPVLVVLGNPPWCGRPARHGRWITELLHGYRLPGGREDEGYFRLDGRPLGERNPKWLHDEYVRFLRLAQWRVEQAGRGIVALVVNHNTLEAPTFRGLRRSLLNTFEEVFALDLHGNARKRERTPCGGRDESVFAGIAQGAAVLLLVKNLGGARRVRRADLHGSRAEKLRALRATSVETTAWRPVEPRAPLYLFAVDEGKLPHEHAHGLSLPEIFPVRSAGVITGRDAVATGLDRRELEERLLSLRGGAMPRAGERLDAPRRERLGEDRHWRRRLTRWLARPFDLRDLFYGDYLLARPRRALMDHLHGGGNVALIAPRQAAEEPGALVTRWIAGHKTVSAYGVNTVFPLYLFQESGRVANLAPGLLDRLAERYGERPAPEEVFGYIYGALHSPAYRRRFREPWRRDFPRVAFPCVRAAFHRLALLGARLIELHLLRGAGLESGPAEVEGDPGAAVTRAPLYRPGAGCLDLGTGLRLHGIAPEVWSYRVGGYPVLRRWLGCRAGRALGPDELRHLRRTTEALRRTLALHAALDAAYLEAIEQPAPLRVGAPRPTEPDREDAWPIAC